jgi:hypothetical protein
MKTLKALIARERKLLEAATPGPYRVERVDHDHDEITYEVSSPDKGFHVVFRESDSADEGVCNKAQSHFYANVRTSHEQLLSALEIAMEAFGEAVTRVHCSAKIGKFEKLEPMLMELVEETSERIEALLAGEGK